MSRAKTERKPQKKQRPGPLSCQPADRTSWVFVSALGYLTTLALAVQPAVRELDGDWLALLFGSFSIAPALHLFLFLGLCLFYSRALEYISAAPWPRRDKLCVTLPAGAFAAAMVFGRSFADTNSWDQVFKNSLQFAKGLIAWNGYFILACVSIALLYTWLPTARLWRGRNGETFASGLLSRYRRALLAHPFRTAFCTLLVAHLPVLILSYPGLLMGDTGAMIAQGFNIENWNGGLILIDETVQLTNSHPVMYTLLLHGCLVLGKAIFGSYNIGLFLVSLFQTLAQVAVFSAVLAQLIRLRLRSFWAMGLLAYFALAPRIQNYATLFTKDTLAGCALLLFVLCVFRLVAEQGEERWNMLGCALSGVGVSLLRNEGRFTLLVSLALLMLLLPKKRRKLALPALALLVSTTLFFRALLPAAHITPGSKRETLSVPFQQTARYLRDYPDDVTAQEWAAIDGVLSADTIAERYEPTKSDNVKSTYREAATAAERWAYFKAWFQMGLRHPDVYLQATMNNYYNYFYPGRQTTGLYSYSWSEDRMERANEVMEEKGLSLELRHPDVLAEARESYQTLRENLFRSPLFSLLNSASVYVWGLILLAVYHIKRRDREGLALTVPLLAFLCFYLMGPVNGEYFRYLYGVSLALPAVFLLSLYPVEGDRA